eukprot:TRINITY_DN81909_c0_g1_i1.p1 TRINITY_DN81909_c0_g1~~TRINITY_DN81909_c0_g1_i1.p1  ORF type:complete len:357 (+),score=49.37 TRINITY_DN81909_c0_g1_i1:76-1146(+)
MRAVAKVGFGLVIAATCDAGSSSTRYSFSPVGRHYLLDGFNGDIIYDGVAEGEQECQELCRSKEDSLTMRYDGRMQHPCTLYSIDYDSDHWDPRDIMKGSMLYRKVWYSPVGRHVLLDGHQDAVIYNGFASGLEDCQARCSSLQDCVTMRHDSRLQDPCTLYNIDYDTENLDTRDFQRLSMLYRKASAQSPDTSAAFASVSGVPEETEEKSLVPLNLTQVPPELKSSLRGGSSMSWRRELLSYVNQVRTAAGLSALGLNAKLNAAAQAQSDSGRYGHTWRYIENEDYTWSRLGQNIASGHSSVHSAFSAWYNEVPPHDGHRKNILNAAFNQMGAGWDGTSNLWTQNFGASSSEPCS